MKLKHVESKTTEGHGACSIHINCLVELGDETNLSLTTRLGAYSYEKKPTRDELLQAVEMIWDKIKDEKW